MIGKSKHYDEVRIEFGNDERVFAYIDYNQDGHFVTWGALNEVDKLRAMIVFCKIIAAYLSPHLKVKAISIEMMLTAHLEKKNGSPPIKEEPPF